MIIQLYIKGERLSLFKDENISIKSNITDSSDISKNVGDYSKTFTVPADSINNRIFRHYYNATIDNTFDARTKVDGRINLDGLPFKVGKWRLSKVNVKSGLPVSYTINFFGNLISLKDKYKNDELSTLDLTDFNHPYNSNFVKTGLTSGLFENKIVYNLLAKKQYYYNSINSDHTQTEQLSNIAHHPGHDPGVNHGVKWNDLFPAIQLIEIIKVIENDYGIIFSRDFFGRSEFTNLYMWLNNDTEAQAGGGTQQIDWDSGSTENVNLTTNVATFTADMQGTPSVYYRIRLAIVPDVGYEAIPYQLQVFNNGEIIAEGDKLGVAIYLREIADNEPVAQNLTFNIVCSQEFRYKASLEQWKVTNSFFQTYVQTDASFKTIASNAVISKLMPKMKIIDFLKGIFKMFKLVAIPINNTEVYIDTIDNYYANGRLIDVSRYINYSSYDVERGNILNEINFKFSEPETILNSKFKDNTGIAYGDELLQLADENGEPLDGDKLEIELPFEQVVYERLMDLNTETLTNIMYGAIINSAAEKTAIKPHIFYNIKQRIGSKTIDFLNDNGTRTELSANINTPSHTINFTDKRKSCIFSAEYSNWDGNLINNTLFSDYYKNYVTSIFNIKRRTFKYKAILPLNILSTIKLNDVLKIKDEFFRIDNFNLNLTTGEADLELINSFENDLTQLRVLDTVYFIDMQAQRFSVNILNAGSFEAKVEPSGDGWLLTEIEGDNVFIKTSENSGDFIRRGIVTIFNEDKEIEITVIQSGVL